MNWLISLFENGVHGILADEMGLGKTIQTIALFAHLHEHDVKGPFLIVAPLSTLTNWENEINKFTPTLKTLLYHGLVEERQELRKHFENDLIIITSFEIALKDSKYLKNIKWKYIVIDEAHRLKNFNCKLVRKLKKFNSENR